MGYKRMDNFIAERMRNTLTATLNEAPRRKQRGILLDYNFFFVASDGEFNP